MPKDLKVITSIQLYFDEVSVPQPKIWQLSLLRIQEISTAVD
jgi:hypothetical protein